MSNAELKQRIIELMSERNATGVAIDNAIRGILPEQHPMLNRLQMLANMAKRIIELQDALELAEEAVRAKQVPAVPDGWQLVPVEPTRAMWAAWDSAPCNNEDDAVNLEAAYRAMLAAAPKMNEESVNDRLGKALDMVMAASPALMSKEFEFHGKEVSGPKLGGE